MLAVIVTHACIVQPCRSLVSKGQGQLTGNALDRENAAAVFRALARILLGRARAGPMQDVGGVPRADGGLPRGAHGGGTKAGTRAGHSMPEGS